MPTYHILKLNQDNHRDNEPYADRHTINATFYVRIGIYHLASFPEAALRGPVMNLNDSPQSETKITVIQRKPALCVWTVFGDPEMMVVTLTFWPPWWRRILCRCFLGSTFRKPLKSGW